MSSDPGKRPVTVDEWHSNNPFGEAGPNHFADRTNPNVPGTSDVGRGDFVATADHVHNVRAMQLPPGTVTDTLVITNGMQSEQVVDGIFVVTTDNKLWFRISGVWIPFCPCDDESPSFALTDGDESGPKGHLDVPVTIPDSTTTITVTFTVDPANPGFILDFIRVEFDPLGVGAPFHSEFPGTAGPTNCVITGGFAAGAATIRVFAQSSGATIGDLVDYSIAYS